MTPLISVILPMYGVAKVLPACIDSLKRQAYKHLELIFVDDCGPDNSADLVEQARPSLEAEGMQVRLVRHDRNQGVAAARTTALDVATGEWIFHYDADDRLMDNALALMCAEAQRLDADIVGCQWMLCHGAHERPMVQPQVANGEEAFRMMCLGRLKWNLWLFLVRRSLLESPCPLRFTPGQNMGEDMMLMGKAFLRAGRVSILPDTLYYYTKNDDGQLTGRYTEAHWAQVAANLVDLETYVQAYGNQAQERLLQYLKLNLKLPLLISPRQADYDRWASWLTEAHPYIMENDAQALRTKLLQLMASRGQWWIVRLYYEIVMKRLYTLLYK